jgi:MoaA/NifB/PqqE/SkfB family radical SAM enzyme
MDGGATGVQDAETVAAHEAAAHEKRNWVRLTYRCNDRCIFCLDSHTHDGTDRERAEIHSQIIDGAKGGAQRLILSGGEPTIHPNFVDFIKLGRLSGYSHIQTVTNGRMFAYPGFLEKCLAAGLREITFSIHGSNARIHDALVGTKGAFEQEVKGLENALSAGVIVNIDVCVNRGNVKDLPGLMKRFTDLGVREFDLLHVIPFGRAYTEGKETLFYDLEEMRPYLLAAFEYARKPDMHVWLNRFPPEHLEGFEDLIQDPYKLNDEIRGRKEEYAFLLEDGVPLDCRHPDRCRHCYLERVCDTLDDVRETLAERQFSRVRLDSRWEASLPTVYGGDPASKKRSEQLRELPEGEAEHDEAQNQVVQEARADGRVRLPLLGQSYKKPVYVPLETLMEESKADQLWIVAADNEDARPMAERFAGVTELELELDDYADMGTELAGRRIARAHAKDIATVEDLLARDADFEVVLELSNETAPWLLELEAAPARLVVRHPTHERASTSRERDVNLAEFFSQFTLDVPVENVPTCVLGPRKEREVSATLDGTMLTSEGRLEIFRYIRRYIDDRYWVKSLRCRPCIHADSCRGMHVNYIRAHGFDLMSPVTAPD